MLLNVITRNSILSITCSTTTILVAVYFPLMMIFKGKYSAFVDDLLRSIDRVLILLDAYTNCISLALTYNYFKDYYYKICGWIDYRCKIFCGNILGDLHVINIMQSVNSVTSTKTSAENTVTVITTPTDTAITTTNK
eukprot:433291_1